MNGDDVHDVHDVDAAIRENLRTNHYGQRLAADGVAVLTMDEEGRLRRWRPDGTTTALEDAPPAL